jgi:hypothetical protein
MPTGFRSVCGLTLAAALAGCGGSYFADADSTPPPSDGGEGFSGNRKRVGVIGDMFGEQSFGNVTIDGRRNDALAASVNRHLWAASLDTLSFMPIASTDPFTGVIATDWASTPDSPSERIKVTAYVTNTYLAPESLRVAVFREAQDGEGRWIAAPVAAETPRKIEDAILVRARQIRIAEEEAG